jgi:hypothetical protein
MTLERKMKKKLSDSAAHMSAERKEKKKEVIFLFSSKYVFIHNSKVPRRNLTMNCSSKFIQIPFSLSSCGVCISSLILLYFCLLVFLPLTPLIGAEETES